MDDQLTETAVQPALTTRWLGRPYHYVDTIGSSNDRLKEMVAAGDEQHPPAGTVLLTDYQSQGRGRLNRRWQAPPGSSLLLSVLFRPDWPAEQAHWVTMVASLAAAEAIEAAADLTVGVKWPNDLLVAGDGDWRKVSGLLLEGVLGDDGRLQSAILGIGINVNIPPSQMPQSVMTPATSLMIACGLPLSRLALLVDFLQRLETGYEAAAHGRSPQPAWNQRLIMLGESVQVTNLAEGKRLVGVVEGTDAWGRLRLRDDEGQEHAVAAGDVSLRF